MLLFTTSLDEKLLSDYGLTQDTMVIYCDNSGAINISKNLVQHSRTKHIEIRYHFIRDLVERKIVDLEYIPTDHQNDDIFPNLLIGASLSHFVK